MNKVYIGLGSNLENPAEQIKSARITITEQLEIEAIDFSCLYSSPPMGPRDQPNYVNAVMSIQTSLSAIKLLRILQKIENDFGRDRSSIRWGARTLDLDILLFADQQINTADLIVPHIGLTERAFVIYPLSDIAPDDLLIPGKKTVKQLLLDCPMNGLEKMV